MREDLITVEFSLSDLKKIRAHRPLSPEGGTHLLKSIVDNPEMPKPWNIHEDLWDFHCGETFLSVRQSVCDDDFPLAIKVWDSRGNEVDTGLCLDEVKALAGKLNEWIKYLDAKARREGVK